MRENYQNTNVKFLTKENLPLELTNHWHACRL